MASEISATPIARTMARLLDASAALLAPESVAALGLPDDDLHREILLPLLPAMLADKAIRGYWHERAATGFIHRLKGTLDRAGERPEWQAADFEIHVTASYLAGPDARALADTLLSEESLREMAAAILNAALIRLWPGFASGPTPVLESATSPTTISIRFSAGRKTRRSIIRIADAGTFTVRRLLAGHWVAHKNHR